MFLIYIELLDIKKLFCESGSLYNVNVKIGSSGLRVKTLDYLPLNYLRPFEHFLELGFQILAQNVSI